TTYAFGSQKFRFVSAASISYRSNVRRADMIQHARWAPSPLVGEGWGEGLLRYEDQRSTPHPARFARHPLPQGERVNTSFFSCRRELIALQHVAPDDVRWQGDCMKIA